MNGYWPMLACGAYREFSRSLEKGCGAADLVIQGCGQSFGIAFDGKARTIVILADMHGNELFGAFGNKFVLAPE